MQRTASHLLVILMVLLMPAAALTPAAALSQSPPDWLLGRWVLNSEKSHDLQPKQGGGGTSGFGTPTISVGGVYVPLPGGGDTGVPAGGARDPRVLRCEAMTVSMDGADVHFLFEGSGEETMKPGNDQGRKTSWNGRRLTQSYSTTVRSVRKTYEIDDDGSLVVKVKINPKGGKSATHVRVFERPAS